jgi:DNA-binding LacI/PurR family transcriptional regulator
MKVANELGYRPNRIARSLVSGRTHTIGVVPVEVDRDILTRPTVHLALNGIFNSAAELKQDLLIFTGHDRNESISMADDLLDSRADGVVFISPRVGSPALRMIADSTLPFAVVADDSVSPSFTMDNRRGAMLVLEHLYELGHRRIAHITGDKKLEDAGQRRTAYLEFMEGKGLPVLDGYLIEGDYWFQSGYASWNKISRLEPRPTAVFCANDGMACGLIKALDDAGVKYPAEISVAGFDDAIPAGIEGISLTTIRQPIMEMATAALKAVVEQIETGLVADNQLFIPMLIVRSSTGRPPQS